MDYPCGGSQVRHRHTKKEGKRMWMIGIFVTWAVALGFACYRALPSETERGALDRLTPQTRRLLYAPLPSRWSDAVPEGRDRVLLTFWRRRLVIAESLVVASVVGVVLVFSLATKPDHGVAQQPRIAAHARPAGPDVVKSQPTAVKQPPLRTGSDEPEEEETLEQKRDPIRLYSTARVLPKYDNEQLLGLSIEGVSPDSFWADLGFRDGDFVLELNGELMNTPAQSVAFMNALHSGHVVIVRVRGRDGDERMLEYRAPR